jgi:hypothetical protein
MTKQRALRFLIDPQNRVERELRMRVHGVANVIEGVDMLVRGESYRGWALDLCLWEAQTSVKQRRAARVAACEEEPGSYVNPNSPFGI